MVTSSNSVAGVDPLTAFDGKDSGRCEEPSLHQELPRLSENVRGSCKVSFERLYALTSPSLLGLILSINADPARAELALEETFVQAWRHRAQIDVTSSRIWLATIARSVAMSGLTKERQ